MIKDGHIPLKYISKKEYLDDFLAGNLYMNTLYYFWNEYTLDAAIKEKRKAVESGLNPDDVKIQLPISPKGQSDLFEGTIATGNMEKFGLSKDFATASCTDMSFRALGYQYCNVSCFTCLEYAVQKAPLGYYDISWKLGKDMGTFGEFVVIIKDEKEFMKRVKLAVQKAGYKFIAGKVNYHKPTLNGAEVDVKHAMILKAEMEVDIRKYKAAIIAARDCFDKNDAYQYQQEWRIALYRGEKSTDAYVLQIGDINDIVEWTTVGELDTKLRDVFQNHRDYLMQGDCKYYRNIGSKRMRELFYALGDYKAVPLVAIG